MTTITADNESFCRTFHPTLAGCEAVTVHEDIGQPSVWLVSCTAKLRHTHAGGREIHRFPRFECPPSYPLGLSFPSQEDPISHRINLRRMLTANDRELIMHTFVGSVGVRLFIAGWVVVLFHDRKSMEMCWARGVPDTVGGRRLGYEVVDLCPSSLPVGYGTPISSHPHDFTSSHGCLGLRLLMPTGETVITTTTHAFVKLNLAGSSIWRRAASWYLSAKDALSRFYGIRSTTRTPAVVESRSSLRRTSLGTEVWLAGTDQMVRKKTIRRSAKWRIKPQFKDLQPSLFYL